MTDYRDHFEPHPNIPFEQDTGRKGMIGPFAALIVIASLFVAAFFLSSGTGDISAATPATAPAAPETAAQ